MNALSMVKRTFNLLSILTALCLIFGVCCKKALTVNKDP